ncbi:Lrp/AsnC family transcriptional regulator [Pseudaquidulcibacter saccharophilus]|uniref:Lrp/AsnC family transcriptional regulator n=1 Tax=Pseudaquidulcibacter saccharophilus TaxID=2831900 RepID=UPI001EFEF578|nr:Lrp/AsnC family transcriptional regulator [Pseudaquidulcibacter saccharophilus]
MGARKAGSLDKIDRRIIKALMERADIPIAELAKKAGLSQTPCWQRVQKLEQNGVIQKRVAIVDPKAIGLNLTVVVAIEANEHTANWLAKFTNYVTKHPQVVDVLRMAGDVDYVLKLIVEDMASYDKFYKGLIENVPLKNVSSRFVMETIKNTTVLAVPEPEDD